MHQDLSTSERIAGWIYDRRWVGLGVCLVLAVGAAVPALRVTVDNSVQRWFVEGDPALTAYRSFQDTYGNDETVLIALQRDEGMLTPAGLELLQDATRELRAVEGVASVQSLATMKRVQVGLAGPRPVALVPDERLSPDQARALRSRVLGTDSTRYGRFVNDDGTVTAVLARMQPNDQIDGRRDVILDRVRTTLGRVLEGTSVDTHRAGVGVILRALNKASTQDSMLVLLAANVLIFLLLWGFFRRVAPVLLTLGVVGVATVWLMGAYGWAGLAINTVTLVMPTLVLVICTADCVHLLRHAADLPADLAPRERAVQTVGFLLRPCGITTLTTALGFGVLGVSSMPVVRHLGLFSALGLVFGFVASLVGCTWGLAYDAVLPVSSDRGGLRQAIESTVGGSLHYSRAVLGGAVLLALWREPAREPSLFAKTDEEFYRYGGVITTIHNQEMSAEEVIHHHRIHHHRGRGNAERTRWRGQKRDWSSPPALREGGKSNLVRGGNAHTQPSEADAAGGASSRLEA